MTLLVTSAAGSNGTGYGALRAFDDDGRPLGSFSKDSRIVDPRGLSVDRKQDLLFLNSGADRALALDRDVKVVRDTGAIAGLNPGGGNFGPDGRYYVGLRSARSIMAFPVELGAAGEHVLPPSIRFPAASPSAATACCSLLRGEVPMTRASTLLLPSLQAGQSSGSGE